MRSKKEDIVNRKVIVRAKPEVNEDEESLYLYVYTKKSISLRIYNFSPFVGEAPRTATKVL